MIANGETVYDEPLQMEPGRTARRARWVPAILASIALAATTSVTRDACAQDVRAAEEAFRRAGERYLRRDFNAAANFYEASYRSAPSWQALLGAIRAHRQSEGAYHMTRAATFALEMVERYPTQRAANRIAQQTLTELSPQLFRVVIACDAECEVEVDGVLQTRRDFFLEPGSRTLTAHFGETLAQRRTVDARAGGTGEVAFTRPPPPPPPPPRDTTPVVPPPPPPFRFHPAVPIATGVVGVGLLTGAAISWFADAVPRGRRLIENANMGIFIPEQERAVYAAEDRTTGLLVAGSIVTAAGVGLAVFTRWSFAPARPTSGEQAPASQNTTVSVLPTPGGAAVFGQF